MIRSSLVKSACVAIALLGLSAPQAGAIEMQGSNPSAHVERRDDLESVYRASRRDRCGAARRRLPSRRNRRWRLSWRRLPRRRLSRRRLSGGGVYRGAGVYRGGYGGWARPGWYRWGPGGAIAAGAAVGVLAAGAAVAYAGPPPAPGLCWYYTDPSYRQGFWDACQ